MEVEKFQDDEENVSKEVKENKNHYFISLQLNFLRYLSLWPPETDNQLILALLKMSAYIRITLMLLISIGQLIQLFFMPNLGLLSSVIDLATLTTSAVFKSVFILVHAEDFQGLNRVIYEEFHETPIVKSTDSHVTMRSLLKYKNLLCNSYCVSGFLIMTLWAFTPLFNSFLHDGNPLHHNNNATNYVLSPYHDLKMPINSWLPFSPTWSPLYQIVFLVEYITLIDSTMVYGFEDCYFNTLLYCACAQLDILCESLKNIKLNLENRSKIVEDREENQENRLRNMLENRRRMTAQRRLTGPNGYTAIDKPVIDEVALHNILKQCIDHHIVLLKFLRDYEKLSQTMIIVDFLHAIISLSFALLEITVSQNIIEYTKMLLFLVICIFHQFLNNHFGELIIQKQMSIAEAAYDLPWEDRSPQFKTSIKIMIMRSQQPVILNGLKMYFLCYKTFMENSNPTDPYMYFFFQVFLVLICFYYFTLNLQFSKALISYFMVLRTLQEGK